MGAANIEPQSGGSRTLDAEINLVPFIDLLSVCICFLLMTAVWTQVATLQVKQSKGTEAADAPRNSYEMDIRFLGPTKLNVQMKKGGRVVQKKVLTVANAEALPDELNGLMEGWMSKIQKGSKSAGVVSSAFVTPLKGVEYGSLVAVMDTLRKNRIVNLGVVPVSD